ncbi:MAG TPA: hypothetical protein VN903_02925, partial [Polyangia bacterium]|nr:hypothetical protein [Polyangia bacterium]
MRALVATAALAAGCSSAARPDLSADGSVARGICDVVSTCTPDPNGVCQHSCTPDPGPRLVNCGKAEQNFEFYDPPLWTFEEDINDISGIPLARSLYSYTDNSTTIRTFTIDDGTGTGHRMPKTWQPPTTTLPRCSDKLDDNNQTIHIQGGPFLSWGGGVGIGMKNFPAVQGTVPVDQAMKDFSDWEGVSFWARRGPDSQVGFRVLVGDKYTDDDISYLMYKDDPKAPRFCERVRECACLNHKTCAPVDLMRDNGGLGRPTNSLIPSGCVSSLDLRADEQTMMFCGTPQVISGAGDQSSGGSQCNTCEGSDVGPGIVTRCNEKWPAYPDDAAPGGPMGSDVQFYGKPCSPYTMRNGIFSYWCFDPASEHPAETTE